MVQHVLLRFSIIYSDQPSGFFRNIFHLIFFSVFVLCMSYTTYGRIVGTCLPSFLSIFGTFEDEHRPRLNWLGVLETAFLKSLKRERNRHCIADRTRSLIVSILGGIDNSIKRLRVKYY